MVYEPRKTYEPRKYRLGYYLLTTILAAIATGCNSKGLFEKSDLTKSITVGTQGIHGASRALMDAGKIEPQSIDERIEE
jgi:hypothetical protein